MITEVLCAFICKGFILIHATITDMMRLIYDDEIKMYRRNKVNQSDALLLFRAFAAIGTVVKNRIRDNRLVVSAGPLCVPIGI